MSRGTKWWIAGAWAAWEGGRLRAAGAIGALFALSVALGAASHYVIERPAQAWARRIERRRREAAAGQPGGDAPGPEAPGPEAPGAEAAMPLPAAP